MERIGNHKVLWVIRFLVLVAAALVVYSFTRPWWVADFGSGAYIKIYGWGLRDTLKGLAGYVAKDITPQWQVIMAWVYVGVSCLLAFFSTWMKRIWGALLLGLIGAGFIAYPVVTIYMVIAHRIATFSIHLEGITTIARNVTIITNLTHSHYLNYAGGALLVLLALILALSKYWPFHRK
jgi:hypothetical protein